MAEDVTVLNGIGPKTRIKLHNNGYRNVSDLLNGCTERGMVEEVIIKWLLSIGVHTLKFAKKCFEHILKNYYVKDEKEPKYLPEKAIKEEITDVSQNVSIKDEKKSEKSVKTLDIKPLLVSSTFSLVHFNVQSLKAKYDDLIDYLSDQNFDCIGLTETWLKEFNEDEVTIPGYTFASNYIRKVKKRVSGGSSTILKNIHTPKISEDLEKLGCDLDFEISCTEIEQYDLIVVTIYRSPSNSSKPREFFFQLEKLLEKIDKKRVLVCGDFNFDLLKSDPNSTKLKDMFKKHGMQPAIEKEPTRVTRTTATLLDNIFTNVKSFSAEVIKTAISDHYGQRIDIPLEELIKNESS